MAVYANPQAYVFTLHYPIYVVFFISEKLFLTEFKDLYVSWVLF
jgi:hypothetical protein